MERIGIVLAILQFACIAGCASPTRNSRPHGPANPFAATYELTTDSDGFCEVTCTLSNVSERPLYVSAHLLCDWSVIYDSGSGAEADGAFWMPRFSNLPVLYRLDPVRQELVDQGLKPDWSLRIPGKLVIGGEKVDANSGKMSITLHVETWDRELRSSSSFSVTARDFRKDAVSLVRIAEP